MDQTQLMCLMQDFDMKTIIERQNLTQSKVDELNKTLYFLINNTSQLNWMQVKQFNKISGLYVNFLCRGRYYSIELDFDGSSVYFEAKYRMFNHADFDSDDEEENSKMTSYHFVPFERLYPKEFEGKFKTITLEMYFEFVYKCLTMRPEDHVYRK